MFWPRGQCSSKTKQICETLRIGKQCETAEIRSAQNHLKSMPKHLGKYPRGGVGTRGRGYKRIEEEHCARKNAFLMVDLVDIPSLSCLYPPFKSWAETKNCGEP